MSTRCVQVESLTSNSNHSHAHIRYLGEKCAAFWMALIMVAMLMWLLTSSLNRRTYSYSEPQLYSQNSGGNYFDTQGSSSQVSTVVTSHGLTNNGGGGTAGISMGLAGGQVISNNSGTYLMDNSGPHPATQTARASPATVSCATSAEWVLCLLLPACFRVFDFLSSIYSACPWLSNFHILLYWDPLCF